MADFLDIDSPEEFEEDDDDVDRKIIFNLVYI